MRVAIIGGGPVGLEMACAAEEAGHTVTVYEAGEPAHAVRSWGHVRLFTPWRMNTTARGRARTDWSGDLEACPTGAELVEHCLQPLAERLDVRPHHRVEGVSRKRLRKGQALGSAARTAEPFTLLLATPDGETTTEADAVVDASGVLDDPAPAGPSGLPLPGERALAAAGRVLYGLVPGSRIDGARIAVLGAGATGTTLVLDLLDRAEPPAVHWLTLGPEAPAFASPVDDRLPERRRLWTRARTAVEAGEVTHHPGAALAALEDTGLGVRLVPEVGAPFEVDRVVVCAGFRPDHRLERELQVHWCWGSEGPMKLAAALLAADGGSGDCLDQSGQGPEALVSPEPRFFVLGAKSYGRRSDFLLQVGHAQIEDVLGLIAEPSARPRG